MGGKARKEPTILRLNIQNRSAWEHQPRMDDVTIWPMSIPPLSPLEIRKVWNQQFVPNIHCQVTVHVSRVRVIGVSLHPANSGEIPILNSFQSWQDHRQNGAILLVATPFQDPVETRLRDISVTHAPHPITPNLIRQAVPPFACYTLGMDEQLYAEWQEHTPDQHILTPSQRFLLLGGGLILMGVLGTMGFFLANWNFYFAAVVVLLSVVAIFVQNRRGIQARTIRLTSDRIMVDDRSYALVDLAGFWWEQDQERLLVTVEHKKPKLLPVSFFFASANPEEAQTALTKVLPEIEPRSPHFTDQFGRFFRF